MAKRKVDDGFKWTEGHVFAALETVHPGPDKWTLVPHLPDATSFDKVRTVDAMAFGCWRSVGIAVHGYEIKVSRGDWLREVNDPEKSLGFSNRCNYWWIAAPAGIVKLEELPATWGLREVAKTADGYSVKIRRQSTFNPNPVFTMPFVVALARACYRKSPDRIADQKEIDAAYERGRRETKADKVKEMPWEIRAMKKELSELKDLVAKFESASGLRLDAWEFQNVGEQVKALQAIGNREEIYSDVVRQLERLLANARILASPPGEPDPKPLERRAAEKKREQAMEARGIGRFDDEYYRDDEEILDPGTVAEIVGNAQTIPVDPEADD